MSVMVPRLVGGVTVLWVWRSVVWGPMAWTSPEGWIVATTIYLVAALWLLVGRRLKGASGLLALATIVEMMARPAVDNGPVILLAWIAAVLLLTDGEPLERAFLLRVCTTSVYTFAAASKVNPSWLVGEGVRGVEAVRDGFGEPAAILFPLAIIALEASVGLGLWFAETRAIAAVAGVALHIGIVLMVSAVLADVLYLVVLNFGLVVTYPAFWVPLARADLRPA